MTDAPTPLDLDAIVAAIAECRTYNFGMYQADRLAHEHAPALVEEVERLRAEVAIARQHQREASSTIRSVEGLRKERDDALAEVARLRTMVGDCHCDKNPETTNGPEEDCPQHGRPVAEVWGLVERAEAEWDHARAEVGRLRAEVRLAKASARPAPAWDEDAVRDELVVAAREAHRAADTCSGPWADEAMTDAALAVVRDHQPVKPDRETVARALAEHRLMGGRCRCGLDPRLDYYRYEQHVTDAVLSLLPGRSEAEVKAEALREFAARVRDEMDDSDKVLGTKWATDEYRHGMRSALMQVDEEADRLAAEEGADRG